MIKPQKNKKQNTVFVGLSGGVDSSVSAYLLKKAGYKVVGAFIKTWQPEWLPCTWKEERRDAMRAAAYLNIPFVTIDLESQYKKQVADYMIKEYEAGRTPNPDVMCNKEIKFGAFLKKAMSMGADFVATGHYARKVASGEWLVAGENKSKSLSTKHYSLASGMDPSKDQSYFLWTLNQDQLSKILFPIGHMQKTEVRKIAKKIDLPNAEKKDSQGICFLGKISMKDFLGHYITEEKGKVLNMQGEEIGWHTGALFFTVGERHGFVVEKRTSEDKPLYVVEKDVLRNTIIVGGKDDLEKEKGGIRKEVAVVDVNWISETPKKENYRAQIRYHQEYQDCKVRIEGEKVFVVFKNPQIAAPGQSIVVYDKDTCLGGGIVE